MKLTILTPEKTLFSADAEELILTTVDGEIGILDRHAPLLAAVKAGKIKVKVSDAWQEIPCSKGLLEVQNSNVVVLLEE